MKADNNLMAPLSLEQSKPKVVVGFLKSKTRHFSRERVGRILVGVSVLLTLLLTYTVWHHCIWLLVPTSLNLIQSGFTDKCVVKNVLDSLGFPSEKECGRLEAIHQKNKEDF